MRWLPGMMDFDHREADTRHHPARLGWATHALPLHPLPGVSAVCSQTPSNSIMPGSSRCGTGRGKDNNP